MFQLTGKAYDDLKGIAVYTKKAWGKNQCVLYLRMLDSAFQKLSDSPEIGVKIDEIREGYFKYPVGRHLIFYRRRPKNNVQIVRILHQRMDVDSIL